MFRAECEVVGVRRRKGGGDGAEARREDRVRSRRGRRGRAGIAEVGESQRERGVGQGEPGSRDEKFEKIFEWLKKKLYICFFENDIIVCLFFWRSKE